MDITVHITNRKDGKSFSHTFIGDKDKILPGIQELISRNRTEYIEVVSEDGDTNLTNDELFREKK